MPKLMIYRAKAIIYFENDRIPTIPLLQEGKVELTFNDLHTGAKIREPVKTGEFFGIKTVLSGHPSDETAIAISDCKVLLFTVPEFENIISKNPKLLLKMLEVFSSQLRRIHNQVQTLLVKDAVTSDPEANLIALSDYYMKQKEFSRAVFVCQRYLHYWPDGQYADMVQQKIAMAQEKMTPDMNEKAGTATPARTTFEEIHALYENKEYKHALKLLLSFVKDKNFPDDVPMAEVLVGICLFRLGYYSEAIKSLISFLKEHSGHKASGEAVWYLGLSYEALGKEEKATKFFLNARHFINQGHPLYDDLYKKLKDVKGGDQNDS